jgi:glycosyltransferase involved in cell wall biosynthesis
VAVLLCTHQGQPFLDSQLESIAAQTHTHWQVWASDDASSDETVAVLESHRAKWGGTRLSILRGPGLGFAANFAELTRHPEIAADYYAYADQDDVWEPHKLERAVAWLEQVPAGTPGLYCSRTRLINHLNRELGFSPHCRRPPAFANALVQNLAGGNTMVFNDAARRLLVSATEAGSRPATHDWWTYLLISGCGGRVHYDPEPLVRYRQHGANVVGAHTRIADRARSTRYMLRGRLRRWTDANVAALDCMRDRLTPENQRTFDAFRRARDRSLVPRVAGILQSGVHRQTAIGHFGLIAAAVLKRV